jgi:DNA-binding ferritin-like protein (Dps family)
MDISDLTSKLVGDLGDKRRWRQYKSRAKQLPPSYRTAVEAFERYLMYGGAGGGGVSMFEDLVDLFEQSAADRTPIREIVGEDPVEFIEIFARNYHEESWLNRERARLNSAIERAAGEGK